MICHPVILISHIIKIVLVINPVLTTSLFHKILNPVSNYKIIERPLNLSDHLPVAFALTVPGSYIYEVSQMMTKLIALFVIIDGTKVMYMGTTTMALAIF